MTSLGFARGNDAKINESYPVFQDGKFYVTNKGNFYVDFYDEETNQQQRLWINQRTITLQDVYPVGAIYMSVNNVNPSVLFGFGTWEQIKDTFLLASGDKYNGGETGGEATHKLTVDEMPSHAHKTTVSTNGGHSHQIGTDKDATYTTNGGCWSVHNSSYGASYLNGYTSTEGNHTHTVNLQSSGGGQEHNNMPPYFAVHVWQRVS